ncbi:MAG: hypothetical protein FWD63_05050 [Propionibacteriaceae bacterium]|nr:hypothetical protein [Propionibacteriaceae bacterium]
MDLTHASGIPNGVVVTDDERDIECLSGVPRAAPRLPSGRTPLYVCSQCHDLGCGTFSVRVSQEGDAMIWSDFAWESELEPRMEPDPAFESVPVLRFDRTSYLNVLAQL